jgi:hypothetical protein
MSGSGATRGIPALLSKWRSKPRTLTVGSSWILQRTQHHSGWERSPIKLVLMCSADASGRATYSWDPARSELASGYRTLRRYPVRVIVRVALPVIRVKTAMSEVAEAIEGELVLFSPRLAGSLPTANADPYSVVHELGLTDTSPGAPLIAVLCAPISPGGAVGVRRSGHRNLPAWLVMPPWQ